MNALACLGAGLTTPGINALACLGAGLTTPGMTALACLGAGLTTPGMNALACLGAGLTTPGIAEFTTGCVVGAATALIAETAKTEPRATHETFNHGRIRIFLNDLRKPAERLTEKRMPGTTKVLKLLQKKMR
jgi:hypothetical protein